MKVSYKWLAAYFKKSFFKGGLPRPERLSELLSTHAFEVESMEKSGRDTVFDLKVLPDRAHYALCHRGVARDIGAIIGKRIAQRIRKDAPFSSDMPRVEVKIESPLCRRYVARRINGTNVIESPKEMREMLEAIGARSINSIVDAANYVMFDIGQPLHAFDADKVFGAVTVRLARQGERIELLDGKNVELSFLDLVIADAKGPIAIAGVKGGKRAEVTLETKNLIIESANFDPARVRRTATRLDLRNDASKRFENEITPALAYEAMDAVTKLIWDISPESKVGPVTDEYPDPVKEWSLAVTGDEIRSILGTAVSDGRILSILEGLEFRVVPDAKGYMVTPPLDRLDVKLPADIADEVGRIEGYGKLEGKETPAIERAKGSDAYYWANKAKDILVDIGFSETLLYSLVPRGTFEIAYPLASDKSALREDIATKMKESLLMNSRNADLLGLETIKIFEIGKVFPAEGERTSLCIGVCQAKKKKGVTAESVLKGAVENLFAMLGVTDSWGSISRIETGAYGAMIEIDFDDITNALADKPHGDLQELAKDSFVGNKRYKPFSMYPFITRDVAIFVGSDMRMEEVAAALRAAAVSAAGGLLVKGPDLFDRFEKDGKTSLAFRMIFQSFERTLSDEEANAFMGKVYDAAKKRGWEVR